MCSYMYNVEPTDYIPGQLQYIYLNYLNLLNRCSWWCRRLEELWDRSGSISKNFNEYMWTCCCGRLFKSTISSQSYRSWLSRTFRTKNTFSGFVDFLSIFSPTNFLRKKHIFKIHVLVSYLFKMLVTSCR